MNQDRCRIPPTRASAIVARIRSPTESDPAKHDDHRLGGDGHVSAVRAPVIGTGDPPGESSRGARQCLCLALAFPSIFAEPARTIPAGNTHVIGCGPLQCQADDLLAGLG